MREGGATPYSHMARHCNHGTQQRQGALSTPPISAQHTTRKQPRLPGFVHSQNSTCAHVHRRACDALSSSATESTPDAEGRRQQRAHLMRKGGATSHSHTAATTAGHCSAAPSASRPLCAHITHSRRVWCAPGGRGGTGTCAVPLPGQRARLPYARWEQVRVRALFWKGGGDWRPGQRTRLLLSGGVGAGARGGVGAGRRCSSGPPPMKSADARPLSTLMRTYTQAGAHTHARVIHTRASTHTHTSLI